MAERLSHYVLHELLGTGGMGSVYRATDEQSGRTVAVKTLHTHLARDSEYIRRFEREARTAQSIDSPDVVKVLDSGHEADRYFLVMEYVPGQTLADYITERGQLSIEKTVEITASIAHALVAAGRAGIVHRDISPQNVLITADGRAKVTDFGVSRDLTQATVTATSMLLGKPLYIAPEVVTGASRADIRADVYALGIVIFQMLVGEVPFNADTPYAVMQQHVHDSVPALQTIRPSVPEWLVALVETCLAKDPGARYQSGSGVLNAIDTAKSASTLAVPRPALDATVVDRPSHPSISLADSDGKLTVMSPARQRTASDQARDVRSSSGALEPGIMDSSRVERASSQKVAQTQQQAGLHTWGPSPKLWLAGIPVALMMGAVLGIASINTFTKGSDRRDDTGSAALLVVLTPLPTSFPPTPAPPPSPVPTNIPLPTVLPTLEARRVVAWRCADGTTCQGVFVIGPARIDGNTLRIDFQVSAGPKSVSWRNDLASRSAIYVSLAGTNAIYAQLNSTGGIAARDDTLVPGQTYGGWWEFVVSEKPSTSMLLIYPDFRSEPVSFLVPARP